LNGGETLPDGTKEWWINFYDVADPVSGALEKSLICDGQPPLNIHLRKLYAPGFAHTKYFSDTEVLRYLLGRTYGKEWLEDKTPQREPLRARKLLILFWIILPYMILFIVVLLVVYSREVSSILISFTRIFAR
jgi:hypothetical protein